MGYRILLAEDEEPVRTTLLELLERDGHEVTACSNTEQARFRYRPELFDVVILDNDCPVQDSGRQLAREISRRAILISGRNVNDITGIRFLYKPISLDDLRNAVKQATQSSA